MKSLFVLSHVLALLNVASALAETPAAKAATTSPRPNILFIMADDLGWRDLGCFGSTFHRTPNLDELAARGMRFTQAYAANPLCSPTRSSVLTGLFPARTGITAPACHLPQVILEKGLAKGSPRQPVLVAESVTRLKTDYTTLPEVLLGAGYRTGHFGKWHLGKEPYSPLQHGFEVDFPQWPGPGPAGSYIAPWAPSFPQKGKPGEHLEDTTADAAVKFIREHKDEPFFLNYWLWSVHAPYDAKDELVAKYRTLADPKNPQRNPVYAAMVESLDDAVGRVMTALEENGVLERTVIVFFSDNGGVSWGGKGNTVEHKSDRFQADMKSPPTSNLPLRNGKASLYEGGVREPCIVVWPGVTQPGTSNATVIQSIDWMPTLLDIANVPMPASVKPDGLSLVPLLKDGNNGRIAREAIFTHFPHDTPASGQKPGASVRRGDMKLIRLFAQNDDGSDQFELYDLKTDLGETKNIAPEKPDLVRELNALLDGFLKNTEAVIPKRNPAFKPTGTTPAKQTGWQTSKDTELTAKDGALFIQSTGKDPWLSTRDLPADAQGAFMVKLRMKSVAGGHGVVYFSTAAKPGFNIERSVSFAITHDGAFHDYEIKLPIETLSALRLDPGNAQGSIAIEHLELRDAGGAVIFAEGKPIASPSAKTSPAM